MVPPTIEALMDILEGSKDLSELLDNEVAQDVVEQTRGLEVQTVKKVRISLSVTTTSKSSPEGKHSSVGDVMCCVVLRTVVNEPP